MPTVNEVEPSVVAELIEQIPIGSALCGARPDDAPKAVVTAINDWVSAFRDRGESPERENAVALGVLLGEQYVRAFSWRWASLAYPDGSRHSRWSIPRRPSGRRP